VVALVAGLATLAAAGAQAASDPPALVYVFRAMGGKFVTKDMDNLAALIRTGGSQVEVNNYTAWMAPAKDAIRLYKAAAVKPRIVALGYSAGGDSAIRFALVLKKAQVPVDLIVTLDPTRIANRVPSNVGRFVNLFSSDHTMGGGEPKPARDFGGHFAAVDLKDYTKAVHLDIGGLVDLQEAIAQKVAEVIAAPGVPGPSVPIEYAPPAGVLLEIWDSGAVANASAGDTLAAVAAQFGLPAWLLADVNDMDANKPLAAGQRIVVPRRLAGVAAAGN
jgi:LysM repeat protein